MPPPGIHESSLRSGDSASVFPFAVVEYDLLQPTPKPPHTEDHRYDPATVRFIYQVDEERKQRILDRTFFASVADIFEVPVCCEPGHYVRDGEGPRSLGTVRPRCVRRVVYEETPEGNWKFRLSFEDSKRTEYRLTVTDLTWRSFCNRQRRQGRSATAISADLARFLRSSNAYQRIGLARGWGKFPDRCYLQITGVYSFPDYLNGRTFVDFAPPDRGSQPAN